MFNQPLARDLESASQIYETTLPSGLPAALLRDFSFEATSDGSLLVLKNWPARRRRVVLILIAAVFWNGLIAVIAASYFGWKPGPGWVVECDPIGLVLALPFMVLLGVALIWMASWRLFGREEWLIGRNCLDWQGRLLGFKWRRRYQDAEPTIWAAKGLGISYLVIPFGKSKWRVSRILHESARLDDLIALGRLLTDCTGWSVAVVELADD